MEINKTVLADKYNNVAMLAACEQCGRCSSACPMTGVEGFNVRRVVRHLELDLIEELADTPIPWLCTTCGRCEDVCPNGVEILDIILPLRQLTAPGMLPEGPPCITACPGNIDIPGYLKLISQEKTDEAAALIREKVPFPGILGRVCTRPCEGACRRGEVSDPIAICALKRFAADKEEKLPEMFTKVEADTGHKVAVIGSGPAGLTAGFYLRKKGYQVTIFEDRLEPGGMMRYGIPRYRLPREILEKEVNSVLETGIELKTGQALGKDFDLTQLKAEGYEAVFLAVGAQLSRKIKLEGSESDGVLWGLEFLCAIGEGKKVELKDRVLVIGGGNVAIDAALTAKRLGAREITLACLEKREEMPAKEWEIKEALEEGVNLMPSWGPSRVLIKDEKVSGFELIRCRSVFDEQGNFLPSFDYDTTEKLAVDQIILAIGQAVDLSFLDSNSQIKVERGLIAADKENQATGMAGVYAGGDAARAPGSVIEAIAAGRRAASSIDQYLGGNGEIDVELVDQNYRQPFTGRREKGFADRKRVRLPVLPVAERQSFEEVELGYESGKAAEEASRCLQCYLEVICAKRATTRES